MTRKLLGFALLFFGGVLGLACVTTERVYVQPAPQPPQEDPAPVQETVSYSGAEDEPFYDDLRPYGEWIYVSGPGWVWSPYRVPAGWRPYAYGHWVYTDYGLTWASDESFGWAVYHYGRWYADPGYGWVWVPGTEWGPAWVAWHEGGGYVGWAPLPWQVTWRAGFGLDWGGVSINVALGPSAWYFVHDRDLVATNLHGCVLPAARNVTLIRNTIHVTNYVYVDNRIVDRSVRKEKIGRAVGHPIPSYRVRRTDSPDEGRGGRVKDQEFVVFRRDPGRSPQRREVPPGHDGSQTRGDGRDDRSEDRDPRRREIPSGHDAYPPQDDPNRGGGSQDGQHERDSMQPRNGDSHDQPPAHEDGRRNPPPGGDPTRDRGNQRRPQRYGTPATENSEGQPAQGTHGNGNGKQNSPDSRATPDQGSQGQQAAPQGNGNAGNTSKGTNAPQRDGKQGNAGQGGNAGSVSKPPSTPSGPSKQGNAPAKSQGNKPTGKGKGKKPAPPDPKPETEKPEEPPKDGSGS